VEVGLGSRCGETLLRAPGVAGDLPLSENEPIDAACEKFIVGRLIEHQISACAFGSHFEGKDAV
jgi:hypothetical protein